MKEFAQKNKKHSVNINRINHIQKIPSVAITRPLIACQPKPQPNFIHFTQFAHPRCKQQTNRRDQYKENARLKENDAQLISTRQNKANILLKDQRKSHQSTHQDQLKKTQKKFRAIRQDKPLKGKTEWVSVDDQGNLGCHQNLNSQIFRPGLSRSGLSSNKAGETGVRHLSDVQLMAQFQKRLVQISWKEQTEKLNELVRRQEIYSKSPYYVNYLCKQVNINWMNRAFVLNWMMLLASELHCRRQVFANAVNIFDRYLGITSPILLQKLQLLGATCLFLAQKLQDNTRISASSFWEPISQRHTQQEILQLQMQVAIRMSFRLQAPTVNAWANRLSAQWDLYVCTKQNQACCSVRFKSGSAESYQNFRWMTQYIDFALLDIQTLQYKNRTLAAAFLYLTILLRLQIHNAQEVAEKFRQHSHLILSATPFNIFYSNFLYDSFGFPLKDILPAVQYCSIFVILPLSSDMPQVDREGQLMSFQQYCGIQTYNQSNKTMLSKLNRHFW